MVNGLQKLRVEWEQPLLLINIAEAELAEPGGSWTHCFRRRSHVGSQHLDA